VVYLASNEPLLRPYFKALPSAVVLRLSWRIKCLYLIVPGIKDNSLDVFLIEVHLHFDSSNLILTKVKRVLSDLYWSCFLLLAVVQFNANHVDIVVRNSAPWYPTEPQITHVCKRHVLKWLDARNLKSLALHVTLFSHHAHASDNRPYHLFLPTFLLGNWNWWQIC